MTLRALRPYARARLVPAMLATQPAVDRTAIAMMVGVARRSPAGLRRLAILWAAVSPVQALLLRTTPDRSSADHTPGRRGLECSREDRQSGELAGSLVPVSPAPITRATLLYSRPAGQERVTVGSAEWVDWLTAESQLPRLRVPS